MKQIEHRLTGVLIDPHTRTVTSVELPSDGVSFAPLLDCEYFDSAVLRRPEPAAPDAPGDPGAILYVDDEGMTREGQKFWSFDVRPDIVYAGKGVIVAVNVYGETCNGVAEPKQIARHVVWRAVRFAGYEDSTEEDVEIAPGLYGTKIKRSVRFDPGEEE